MGVRQKPDRSAKVNTARDGDEIFNYAEFKEAYKKYFNSFNSENNAENQQQTSQETKPVPPGGAHSEKRQTPQPDGNNPPGGPKSSSNPLAPLAAGMETLRLMKTELGYSAKPIYQTMVRGAEDFIIDQSREVIGAATGNQMRQGKEYRMATSILGLGNEMFLSTALSMKAEKTISSLKKNADSLSAFNPESLKRINRTLVNAKISTTENFKLKGASDIKTLRRQMDIYGRKFANSSHLSDDIKKILKSKNLSDMSKGELNSLLNKLATNKGGSAFGVTNNKELIDMVKMSIEIKDNKLTSLTVGGLRRPSLLRKGSRIMKTAMEDDATYKGYRKAKETYSMAKIMMKATLYEGKGLYKTTKVIGNAVTKGGEAALKKVGLEGAANVFAGVNDFGSSAAKTLENVASLPGKGINAGKKAISNAGQRVNQGVRNVTKRGARAVGRGTARVAKAGAKKVFIAGGRLIGKDVKTETLSAAGKVIGKGAKTVGSKLGMVVKAPFKVFQIGSKLMSAVQALLKKLFLIVIKFVVGLFIACGAILIILGAFAAIIAMLTAIGDAVSNSLEEFKTETTMGATYDKLLEKEREFNQAISDLINDTSLIPQEWKDEGYTQWTNFNIHYIGPDGKEMSGSDFFGNYTSISTGEGEIVINSTSDRIWTFLKKMGWNNNAIAGIMGNIMNECSMIHTANSSVDIGIVQWTGERRSDMVSWAQSHGYDPLDLEAQLRYLFVESGWESYIANFGSTNWSSPEAAAWNFASEYERYKDYQTDMAERAERESAAKAYYDYYITSQYAFTEEDPELIASVGAMAGSGNLESDGIVSGISQYTGSTIKGILAMAAIYIDQDFNKYGAFLDGIFTDSVYKDYCAKLYDSTHIIGTDLNNIQEYWCPAYAAGGAYDGYPVATETCNNKIPGGSSDDDWTNSGEGDNRKFSLSLNATEDTYQCTSEDCDRDHPYTRYTVLETGPHGSETFSYDSDDEPSYKSQVRTNAQKAMEAKGCTHSIVKLTYKDNGHFEYERACYCDLCKGHIDGDAYVFVSNIYDPSGQNTNSNIYQDTTENEDEEDSETNEDINETENTDGETEDTNNQESEDATTEETDESNNTSSSGWDDSGYDNVGNKEMETRFSMYALDKYATAFDAPTTVIGTGYCTNPDCPSKDTSVEYSGPVSVKENEDGEIVCSYCEESVTGYTETGGRQGDQESVDTANASDDPKAAEKYIMQQLTGKDLQIIDWWKNENFFTNALFTNKTYYRIYDGDENFDSLPDPEDDAEDQNVVNESNSIPFWFNAWSSSSQRNKDFEEHGWDEDSITRVRLLMAGDWFDLYGIQDFGNVAGAPLTEAQLAQLIANTPSWDELSPQRQSIMKSTLSFQENVAKKFGTRYVYGGNHGSLKLFSQLTAADTFDCSSYVCTMLYNAGVYSGPCLSTSGFVTSDQFVQINKADLLPGDILVNPGHHVVLYLGEGKIAHASTAKKPLWTTYNVDGTYYLTNDEFIAMRCVGAGN